MEYNNLSINEISVLDCNQEPRMYIHWSKDWELGMLEFTYDKAINKVKIFSECMSKEFIEAVIKKIINDAEIIY